jgi:hypothetical protein
MTEWEYAPSITGRQKITAIIVGAGLGLLLAVVNIIFKEFLYEWRFMSLPVFVSGAIVILGIAYIPRL